MTVLIVINLIDVKKVGKRVRRRLVEENCVSLGGVGVGRLYVRLTDGGVPGSEDTGSVVLFASLTRKVLGVAVSVLNMLPYGEGIARKHTLKVYGLLKARRV